MLNYEGYRRLYALTRERCVFAVFLLSEFDLRGWTALNPRRLIERGLNDNWFRDRSEKTITESIDDLVKDQFLEYGPAIKGWRGQPVVTVRIIPSLLLYPAQARLMGRRNKLRAERNAMMEDYLQDEQTQV